MKSARRRALSHPPSSKSANISKGTRVCILPLSVKRSLSCQIGVVVHTIEVTCMTPVTARKIKSDSILVALVIILTSPTDIKSIFLKNLKKDILLDLLNLSPSAMSKEELKKKDKDACFICAKKGH